MSAPADFGASVRVVLLFAVSLAALGNATTWELPRPSLRDPGGAMAMEVVGVRGSRALPPRDAIRVTDHARVTVVAPERCHLLVLAMAQAGMPIKLVRVKDHEPGPAIGPGRYQLPGDHELVQLPGPVRFWAACGPESLRYPELVEAAFRALNDAGAGVEGVRDGDELEDLPEGTYTATLVLERVF